MSVSDVMDHKYNEQLQQEEDLSLFERFQRCDMPFETEDVKAAKENVELGDHLAVHRALLTHHFICTGIEEDKIILHTVKPLCDACHRNPGVKCSKRHEVWTKEYTYQEMEDRNMFKVIWPNILKSRCRDVRDSISLAKTFKDDMDSERFVTSCIYGDSVQLDVKQPFFYMKDVLNSIPVFKNNHKKEYLSKQMLTQSEVPHRNPKEECESIILTSCTCQLQSQEEGLQSFTQGKSSSFCQLLTFKEEKTKSQIAFSSLQGSFESLKHITEEFLSCGYDLVSMTSIYESFKVDGDITNGITYPELEAISEMPLHQQRRWFLLIVDKHQFKNEEISATSPISVGDHIIFKRVRVLGMVRYYHSAIVVDVDEDNISLIEYSAPDHFKWNMVLTDIPMIVRTTKSLKELINEEAKKVNWPEVLQRYTPDQVKKRAEDRLGENAYDLLKNNCEHFASWCKCGLNVSLQVDHWVIMAQTTFYSFLAAIKEHSISSCFQPQVLANISDDLALFIKSSSSLSFIAGIVLEMLLAFYQTYSKYCLSADNKVLKDEQWKAEIHEIWSKGSCRVIGGLIFGCAVGAAIGGPIGAGLGNMMIPLCQWLCQDSDMRERVKTAIHQIHQTPTEEYYSEASLQSLQELFDSDCSKVNKDSENSPEEEWLKPIYLLLQSFGVL